MFRRNNTRKSAPKGQSIIEVIIGSIVLVPVALAGLDIAVVVLSNSANDTLAKNAARAAASQVSKAQATEAAEHFVVNFPKSSIVTDVKLANQIDYQDKKQVVVKTVMTVRLPAAFQGMDVVKFQAQAVEPIIAAPADV